MTAQPRSFDNIVVTGKSGAGKQPRIDVLVKEFGLEQLSTGDIFRHYLGTLRRLGLEIAMSDLKDPQTDRLVSDKLLSEMLAPYASGREELGEILLAVKAKHYVDSGLFVPDDLVNELVDDAFGHMGYRGAVLDGYPRTLEQAHHLMRALETAGTTLDLIVLVDNEDEAIVRRTAGRRICPQCKKVFHLEHKPPREGRYCTECGAEVVQRSDDTEEKIWSRLREFHAKVVPTIEYLEGLGIPVAVVPGNLPEFTPEAVRASVLDAIALLEV
jgi:adenylate kinase